MRKLIFIFALMLTVSCDKQDDDVIIIEAEQATNLNLVLNGSEAGKYVAYVDPTDTSDLFDSSWVHINIGALRFPVILPDVNGDLYKLVSTSMFGSRKHRLTVANARGSNVWNGWILASDGTPTNLGQDFYSVEDILCFAEVIECAKDDYALTSFDGLEEVSIQGQSWFLTGKQINGADVVVRIIGAYYIFEVATQKTDNPETNGVKNFKTIPAADKPEFTGSIYSLEDALALINSL